MNTRTATHTLTALAAAAALTALAGCDPSATAQPSETIGTCTECTAAATPTATPTTLDAAAKEKADQAAAAAVWRKFINVVFTVDTMPDDQVDRAVKAVAVDPTASLIVKKGVST
jgi:type IV secretory pathway protease TraF